MGRGTGCKWGGTQGPPSPPHQVRRRQRTGRGTGCRWGGGHRDPHHPLPGKVQAAHGEGTGCRWGGTQGPPSPPPQEPARLLPSLPHPSLPSLLPWASTATAQCPPSPLGSLPLTLYIPTGFTPTQPRAPRPPWTPCSRPTRGCSTIQLTQQPTAWWHLRSHSLLLWWPSSPRHPHSSSSSSNSSSSNGKAPTAATSSSTTCPRSSRTRRSSRCSSPLATSSQPKSLLTEPPIRASALAL
uniref:CUGBP Elav-like family member 3 n=1 Tax=Ovis aries TaxID=9940 RepID=A0AC11E036_SHEEP